MHSTDKTPPPVDRTDRTGTGLTDSPEALAEEKERERWVEEQLAQLIREREEGIRRAPGMRGVIARVIPPYPKFENAMEMLYGGLIVALSVAIAAGILRADWLITVVGFAFAWRLFVHNRLPEERWRATSRGILRGVFYLRKATEELKETNERRRTFEAERDDWRLTFEARMLEAEAEAERVHEQLLADAPGSRNKGGRRRGSLSTAALWKDARAEDTYQFLQEVREERAKQERGAIARVARAHNIPDSTLRDWVGKYGESKGFEDWLAANPRKTSGAGLP